VALVSDEAEIRVGLRRYCEAGVTDFAPSIFAADRGAVERTRDFLAGEISSH
jgi:hypothetical protein